MRLHRLFLATVVLLLFAPAVSASNPDADPPSPAKATVGVIRVPVGSATAAARELDAVFNGSGASRQTRVTVSAIPFTKYVFVAGSPLDVLIMRTLLGDRR